ncbi:major facilitator superfamily domain-containing protein [Stachybotrys elegans]|uniref:Major facilitator superfamily domain-containing protein n=1 Tax=Stachybotrys elegans TaxID=80388 RepID=A0A8K0SP88_9HYPO|nr:major facilitator superfamily domain-containing protein [Stachybotrys elegans]
MSSTHGREELVIEQASDSIAAQPESPVLFPEPLNPNENTLSNGELEDQATRLPFIRLMAAYLCLCLCYFTSYLDMNSVTTALPTISDALDAGNSITWAGTAYLLGQTAFQPMYGRLSDITGRKPILLASVFCIALGDLLCGFARSAHWLYLSRALSGIGGGGISSLVSIIVSDLLSLKDRGKYQGMISLAIGAGGMTGPFIAASLTSYNQGWRWAFWIPACLASLCLGLLVFLLPLKPVTGKWEYKLRQIDWLGIAASIAGIVLLLVPINSGGSLWPWRSALTIPMIIIGGLCFIFFVFYEGYGASLPIMPWRLFRNRSRAILLTQGILHDFVWQSTLYFMPLYFQTVRGYTPLESATLILPFIAAQSIAGASSGPIMSRLARYGPVLKTGFLVWTVGTGLKLVFSRTTPLPVYIVVLSIEGIGVGLVHQPGLVALQALSKTEDRAVATSTRNLLRSLGGVAGVAISTAVQYAVTTSALTSTIPPHLKNEIEQGRWKMNDPETSIYDGTVLDARMRGFRIVFALLLPFMVLCSAGSFCVQGKVLRGDVDQSDERPAEEKQAQPPVKR